MTNGAPRNEHEACIPAFIFSMPRSGSTLLQRMAATHPDVATGPEPTFLLPLLHIKSASEVAATFDQRFTAMAVQDFFDSTPAPQAAFDEMVRAAAMSAYRNATPDGARYFLDKTPKYHMISDDLLRIFPESPAIVLWRNPLSMIASLMSTWGGGGGRWNLHHFRLDLFHALPRMIETVRTSTDRVHQIRYEQLVADPATTMDGVFTALGLDTSESDIERFGEVELVGRIQDPNVSREEFASVRTDRTERWSIVLSNPIRKRWCRRYLRWLGRDGLAVMGYDLDELLDQLEAIPTSRAFLASDLVLVPYDTVYRVGEVGLMTRKIRDLLAGRRPLLAHK